MHATTFNSDHGIPMASLHGTRHLQIEKTVSRGALAYEDAGLKASAGSFFVFQGTAAGVL